MNRLRLITWLLCLMLSACAEPEMLDPRDGTVPLGTDLSGSWVLREIGASDRRRMTQAIQNADGTELDEVRSHPNQGQGSSRSRSAGCTGSYCPGKRLGGGGGEVDSDQGV